MEGLNMKQEAFVNHYLRTRNATQAYVLAYGVKRQVAGVNGHHLLKNPKVKAAIKQKRKQLRIKYDVQLDDYVQALLHIAYADIGDYVKFGQKNKTFTDKVTGEQTQRLVNCVDLQESEKLDTSVIQEVRQGKDGVTIKLVDKLAAWKELSKVLKFVDIDDSTGNQEVVIYMPDNERNG